MHLEGDVRIQACCLCGDEHHAMQCELASSTLIAAKVTPAHPPERKPREAYRTETKWTPRAAVAVHDAAVALGQRLWAERKQDGPGLVVAETDDGIRLGA